MNYINNVFNEDCLVGMDIIPDNVVDMVLCDLPYGTTNCKWDSIIPLDKLWTCYNRVLKKNGVVVLTASQPFTSTLISSNIKAFKYSWVWEKSKATGYLNAKIMPLKAHEDICVFYNNKPTYNPQMVQSTPYYKGSALRTTDVYGEQKEVLVKNDSGMRYPRSVIYFKTAESEGKVIHPTQKPVALMEYLVKTYTNKGDVVLDNCIGSGSTAIACIYSKRNFIGFELNKEYYKKCIDRIDSANMLLF
jgi:DNA modification methylase